MTNKELFETLSNCKFYKKFEKSRNPELIMKEKLIVNINWEERNKEKNRLFLKYIKILGFSILTGFFIFILPFLIVYPPFGKSFLLGIPPILFMVISWMGGAYWAYDKDYMTFMAITLGATPLRIGFGCAWVWLCMSIPDISMLHLVFSMMVYWIIFFIPETMMMFEFNKLQEIPESEKK